MADTLKPRTSAKPRAGSKTKPARSNVVDFTSRKPIDDAGNRDWSVIRTRYIQGAESYADLSKALGISENTVERQAVTRRKNDGKTWGQLRSEFRTERERVAAEVAIAQSSNHLAAALNDQGEIAQLISRATKEALIALLRGDLDLIGEKQGKADVYDKIMAGASRGTLNVRTIYGLTAGQASIGSDDQDLLGGVEIFGLDDEDEILQDIG